MILFTPNFFINTSIISFTPNIKNVAGSDILGQSDGEDDSPEDDSSPPGGGRGEEEDDDPRDTLVARERDDEDPPGEDDTDQDNGDDDRDDRGLEGVLVDEKEDQPEQQEEDSKEEKEDDNRKETDPNEFDNDEKEDQVEEEQLDDDTGDNSKDLANKQTDNDVKGDGEDETKENDLVEEEIANSLTLPQIEGKGEGPNYDCLFDPSLPHCAAEDGECPDGFLMNADEQCVPAGSCPKGYEPHDNDESGTCHPVEEHDCPEGWKKATSPVNKELGCLPNTIVSKG